MVFSDFFNLFNFVQESCSKIQESLQVKIPKSVWKHFWEEPPKGHDLEFWAFRAEPKVSPGDKIQFNFDGKVVAEASVFKIEEPGKSDCLQTGKFKNSWKVFWKVADFKDLRV